MAERVRLLIECINFIPRVRIPLTPVRSFLIGLREYLATKKPKYVEILQSTKTLSEEAENLLRAGIDEFTEEFLSTVK